MSYLTDAAANHMLDLVTVCNDTVLTEDENLAASIKEILHMVWAAVAPIMEFCTAMSYRLDTEPEEIYCDFYGVWTYLDDYSENELRIPNYAQLLLGCSRLISSMLAPRDPPPFRPWIPVGTAHRDIRRESYLFAFNTMIPLLTQGLLNDQSIWNTQLQIEARSWWHRIIVMMDNFYKHVCSLATISQKSVGGYPQTPLQAAILEGIRVSVRAEFDVAHTHWNQFRFACRRLLGLRDG